MVLKSFLVDIGGVGSITGQNSLQFFFILKR